VDVDFHWSSANCIRGDANSTNLRLQITGGNFDIWAADAGAAGDDLFAINIARCLSASVQGVNAKSWTTARPFAQFTNYGSLTFSDNILAGVSQSLAQDASGKLIVSKNQSNILLNDFDSRLQGDYTPTISFGGNSVGQAYIVRSARWWRSVNKLVHVRVYAYFNGASTGKGSSTGAATINLPFTAEVGRTYSFIVTMEGILAATFDSSKYFYIEINTGGTTGRLRRMDNTTRAVTDMTHADFGSYGLVNIEMSYEVA
jgi:hypothetical protein